MKVNFGTINDNRDITPEQLNSIFANITRAFEYVQDVRGQNTVYLNQENDFTAAINTAVHTETAHATTSDPWTGGNTCIYEGGAVTFTDIADAPAIGAVRIIIPQAGDVWTDGAVFDINDGSHYTCVAGDVLRLEAITISTFRLSTITRAALINAPAFAAYVGTERTITSSTFTKVDYDTEDYDSAGAFDVDLARFTPVVPGVYQVNWRVSNIASTGTVTRCLTSLYKNGGSIRRGEDAYITAGFGSCGACQIYLDSNDYIEVWAYITASTLAKYDDGISVSFFDAALIRAD